MTAILLMGHAASAQAPDLGRMDFVLRSVPNGPVALVNDVAIEPDAFRDLYIGELVHWDKANPGAEVSDQLRVNVALSALRQLIQQEILLQDANTHGITVSANELNERWSAEFAKIKQSLPPAEREKLTDDQVLEKLGTTREVARNDLRRVLIIGKMRDRIIEEAGVKISDDQVAKWYAENAQMSQRPETIHVKQLFFKADPKSNPVGQNPKGLEAKKKADRALLQIQSGQSFEKVAREMSDGQFADQGGDWGPRPAAQMPPFIVEAARILKPGGLSPVIESQYGFHVVKLVEITQAGKVPLKQAAPEIRRILSRQIGNQAVIRHCAKTMADDTIVRVFFDLESQLRLRPELLELYRKEMKSQQVKDN